MENVDGFLVERHGNEIHLSFFDIFGVGEVYTLPLADARKIMLALEQSLGPPDNDKLYNDLC